MRVATATDVALNQQAGTCAVAGDAPQSHSIINEPSKPLIRIGLCVVSRRFAVSPMAARW